MIDINDNGTIDLLESNAKSLQINTQGMDNMESKSLQKNTQAIQKYKTNPFVDDDLLLQLSGLKNVYFNQYSRNAIVDTATGEYTPATLQIVKQIKADKEKFVKLYTTHLRVFFELTANSNKLLQYILHKVQTEAQGKDTIYLGFEDADEFYTSHNLKIGRSTFFKGMKELIEKGFLAKSNLPNIYFINPKLFFNGDRVEFITKFENTTKQEVLTKEEYQRLEGGNND
jgi:hypothetical protein